MNTNIKYVFIIWYLFSSFEVSIMYCMHRKYKYWKVQCILKTILVKLNKNEIIKILIKINVLINNNGC